jgi:hypothetical protein
MSASDQITSSNILAPGEHHSGLSALDEIRNKKDATHQGGSIVGAPGPTSLEVSLPSLDPQDFHLKPAIHADAPSSDPTQNISSNSSSEHRGSEVLQIALPRSIEANSKPLDGIWRGAAPVSSPQRSYSAYSNESADYGSLTLSVTNGEYGNGRTYHSVSSDPRFGVYLFPFFFFFFLAKHSITDNNPQYHAGSKYQLKPKYSMN